jgi:Holliday junction resolvase RusA-like endonuclease
VAAAKQEVELVVSSVISSNRVKPISGLVTVQLIWYAPTAHPRDTDGLAPMMKACLDALVKKKVLKDDNNRIVWQTLLGPIVVDRDQPRFELVIQSLDG